MIKFPKFTALKLQDTVSKANIMAKKERHFGSSGQVKHCVYDPNPFESVTVTVQCDTIHQCTFFVSLFSELNLALES